MAKQKLSDKFQNDLAAIPAHPATGRRDDGRAPDRRARDAALALAIDVVAVAARLVDGRGR